MAKPTTTGDMAIGKIASVDNCRFADWRLENAYVAAMPVGSAMQAAIIAYLADVCMACQVSISIPFWFCIPRSTRQPVSDHERPVRNEDAIKASTGATKKAATPRRKHLGPNGSF